MLSPNSREAGCHGSRNREDCRQVSPPVTRKLAPSVQPFFELEKITERIRDEGDPPADFRDLEWFRYNRHAAALQLGNCRFNAGYGEAEMVISAFAEACQEHWMTRPLIRKENLPSIRFSA
jgi:hypothetical protein